MKTHIRLTDWRRRSRGGYSLIEVLVASGILMIGISAAASFSLTMTTQEEINHRVNRGLNRLENYGRLYQLGLEPVEIENLMPPDAAIGSAPNFTSADEANLEGQIISMTINSVPDEGSWSAGEWTAGSQASLATRNLSIRVFRPMSE